MSPFRRYACGLDCNVFRRGRLAHARRRIYFVSMEKLRQEVLEHLSSVDTCMRAHAGPSVDYIVYGYIQYAGCRSNGGLHVCSTAEDPSESAARDEGLLSNQSP